HNYDKSWLELSCFACNDSAVRLYPRYADAFYQRGLCRMQLQQAKCILDFNKTLAIIPKHFQAYLSRAAYYGSKGRYSKAIMNCTEALKIEQHSVRAYLYRGVLKFYNRVNMLTLLLLQKYEEAVESFSKVLKLNPFSLDAYIGRGNAYLEYGHSKGTRQALKDFLTAVHINPVCIKARLCLGYSLQALGKFQKAWTQFSAAIHCDPSCHNAYDGRAIVCLQMGDIFAAFQDTNAALKITTNAELLTNRGVINQFMGYLNCAMHDYQQAITKDPSYALAYFNAANVYFVNKQFSQLLNFFLPWPLTIDLFKNTSSTINCLYYFFTLCKVANDS
uniref:Tetratricopeptide repeat domain 6 n=1 Tax=Naja naja TaxID=35670 RepID=A0A8C7DYK9_NAJNA